MSEKKSPIISIATFWWILIIAVVGVMSAVILYPKMQQRSKKVAELQNKKAALARKEAERNMYVESIDALNNDKEAVERVAKDKYNLFPPGEKVMRFRNK